MFKIHNLIFKFAFVKQTPDKFSIIEFELSFAMVKVIMPSSRITVSIDKSHCANPIFKIVWILPFKLISCSVLIESSSVFDTVFELALKVIAVSKA